MTRKKDTSDIAALLEQEAESIDADRDAPIAGSKVTRGRGRSKTLQIRLNPEELEELERIAESRGLPVSTVAREALLNLVRPEEARDALSNRMKNDFSRYLSLVGPTLPMNDVDVALPDGFAELKVMRNLVTHTSSLDKSAVYAALIAAVAGRAESVSESLEDLVAEMKKLAARLTIEITADSGNVSDVTSS
jgi:hypothetical protein